MKPVIGLTHSIMLDEKTLHMPLAYANAVRAAGGIPVLLPANDNEADVMRMLDMIDGLLLTGGDDVDPLLYGEEQRWQSGDICPLRDAYEMLLCRCAFARRELPVLGICRGIQIMNVALGGTLWQDLASQKPDSIAHRQKQTSAHVSHSVSLAQDSLISSIFGNAEQLLVNSHHHQAVKAPGSGLVVTATAPDGVIEAVEDPTRDFFLGVQWHPEQLFNHDRSACHAKLFEAFVSACKKA